MGSVSWVIQLFGDFRAEGFRVLGFKILGRPSGFHFPGLGGLRLLKTIARQGRRLFWHGALIRDPCKKDSTFPRVYLGAVFSRTPRCRPHCASEQVSVCCRQTLRHPAKILTAELLTPNLCAANLDLTTETDDTRRSGTTMNALHQRSQHTS